MAELRMLFENADTAEWALVRLRERGLHPTRYSVRALSSDTRSSHQQGVLLNTAALLVGMGSVQGTDFNPSGSAWVAFNGAIDGAESPAAEGHRREALLRLEAPEADIKRISGILISNGGRRVSR